LRSRSRRAASISCGRNFAPSLPAQAGNPVLTTVNGTPAEPTAALRSTGSSAYADDDSGEGWTRISGGRPQSNLDLAAELDHTIGGDAEELGRRQGVALHDPEHRDPEPLPARLAHRHDGEMADEERGVHHLERQRALGAALERMRHVRLLHEAVM